MIAFLWAWVAGSVMNRAVIELARALLLLWYMCIINVYEGSCLGV